MTDIFHAHAVVECDEGTFDRERFEKLLFQAADESGGSVSETTTGFEQTEQEAEDELVSVSAQDLIAAMLEVIDDEPELFGDEFIRHFGLSPEGLRDFFSITSTPEDEQTMRASAILVGIVAASLRDERVGAAG